MYYYWTVRFGVSENKSNVINIYVCADKEDRINRIMKLFSLTREAAEVMLEETDKQRAEYYYKNTENMGRCE